MMAPQFRNRILSELQLQLLITLVEIIQLLIQLLYVFNASITITIIITINYIDESN